jgi:DNA-binding IclR family transcriptional regulator
MLVLDSAAHCRRIDDDMIVEPIDMESGRLLDEFLSMPALSLTIPQVARLLDMPIGDATRLLVRLEHDRFLVRTSSGRYQLAQPPLQWIAA